MIRPDGLTLEEFFKKRASEGIQIVLMVCVPAGMNCAETGL
jgi:hypothetical protein